MVERLRRMLGLEDAGGHALVTLVAEAMVLRWEDGTILEPDEPCPGMFVVLGGTVGVADGDRSDELEPGDHFGGQEALEEAPYGRRVVALSECELAIIPGPALAAFVEEVPTARELF